MINKNIVKKIDSDLLKIYTNGPSSLIQTYDYTISGQGKRVRPMLTILTSKSLSGEYEKSYQAALSIEILHNFTLIHDDIMDQDTIRHGKKTVHEKWDVPLAILVKAQAASSCNVELLCPAAEFKGLKNSTKRGTIPVCMTSSMGGFGSLESNFRNFWVAAS